MGELFSMDRRYIPAGEPFDVFLEPGDYTLYYEYERSMVRADMTLPLGGSVSIDAHVTRRYEGAKFAVRRGSEELQVLVYPAATYKINQRSGSSMFTFSVEEADTYALELSISGAAAEQGAFTLMKDDWNQLKDTLIGAGVVFVVFLPFFIWGLVRAIRGMYIQTDPPIPRMAGYNQLPPRSAANREGTSNMALHELTQTITAAARAAYMELFASGERFYYCTLFTTGEGHAPYISAWSHEALAREAARLAEAGKGEPESLAEGIKWSYADSPYYAFAEARMADVEARYALRPQLSELKEREAEAELQLRLQAMELAMRQLDAEGLFSRNQPRGEVVVLVEIMPPDPINTEIAKRLNDPAWPAMKIWLEEAAE